MREVEVPGGPPGVAVWAVILQFIYSLLGLVLGLACVAGGMLLFLYGIAGKTSWVAKVIGLESTITDAAPGAILFVVGLFFVLITRFSVKRRAAGK